MGSVHQENNSVPVCCTQIGVWVQLLHTYLLSFRGYIMTAVNDQKLIDLTNAIKEACADIIGDKDLVKILKGNKTAAVRFRLKTTAVAKLFKEFRQASIECGLVYTHKSKKAEEAAEQSITEAA